MQKISNQNRDMAREINFMDVKELYDLAYAEKAKKEVNLPRFQWLMRQAEKMDKAYRIQLLNKKEFSYPHYASYEPKMAEAHKKAA
ncbi:MAG: hypothetical protein AAF549_06625 [Pseudomonadota bacterium]